MNIEPGTYEAKIIEYGLVTNKSGAPQIKVVFGLKNGPAISYFGGLGSEKQEAYTIKNLLTLGATPQNIDKVEKGIGGGVLNVEKIYSLVIEDNTYEGKTSSRIKFINDPSIPRSASNYMQGTGALAALKGKAAQIAASEGIKFEQAKKAVDDINF